MLTVTSTQIAADAAQTDIESLNMLVKRYNMRKASGVPSLFGKQSCTSAEYLSSMTPANQAIFDAVAAANPQS